MENKSSNSSIKKKEKTEITPLVKKLTDVAKVEKDFDHKEKYVKYLIEKYK